MQFLSAEKVLQFSYKKNYYTSITKINIQLYKA